MTDASTFYRPTLLLQVYHQRELLSGKVERLFELPKNADVDKVT